MRGGEAFRSLVPNEALQRLEKQLGIKEKKQTHRQTDIDKCTEEKNTLVYYMRTQDPRNNAISG